MDICDIFSAAARERQVRQAVRADVEDRWLIEAMAAELFARLEGLERPDGPTLVLGYSPKGMSNKHVHASLVALDADTIVCAEDLLPFDQATFGAVLAIGTLDSVNDLPGALIQIRRSLRPGGRFLGAFAGAGSGNFLRQMVRMVEPGVARVHPQIDVRAAGDLLARAGFFEPVADMEEINVRYSSLSRLLKDVRANGQGNSLAARMPLSRGTIAAWAELFDRARDEGGKVSETVCPVYLSATAPQLR